MYQIKNTITGDVYIGSAVNISRRWSQHRNSLKTGTKNNPHLHCAWQKYGAENFEFSILVLCDRDKVLEWEQKFIDSEKPKYNICKIAGSRIGVPQSEETVERRIKNSRAKVEKYELNGVKGSVRSLSMRFAEVPYKTVMARLKRGYSLEDAILLPLVEAKDRGNLNNLAQNSQPKRLIEFRGEQLIMADIIRNYSSHSEHTVKSRLRMGWELERALTAPLRGS